MAFRGQSQEIYIKRLTGRIGGIHLVDERSYLHSRNQRRGPDLTLLDAPRREAVLLESKARRLRADVRFTLDDAALDQNLADAYAAIQKLPTKLSHLRSGLPEYKDVQPILDQCLANDPMFLVVVGDAVMCVQEIVRGRARQDPSHPLAGFNKKFCIMSLAVYEEAIERARTNGTGIVEILNGYWNEGESLEVSGNAAEHFHFAGPSDEDWYAYTFRGLRPLIAEPEDSGS